jgi:hypothetical protein
MTAGAAAGPSLWPLAEETLARHPDWLYLFDLTAAPPVAGAGQGGPDPGAQPGVPQDDPAPDAGAPAGPDPDTGEGP